jgi:uncharacterized membrane protein YphA (DoxX/SURF4 family)
MSVDTRTPRTPDPSGRPPGDPARRSPSGFLDEESALSTVKVPSDPAEVVVTHASFRVVGVGTGHEAPPVVASGSTDRTDVVTPDPWPAAPQQARTSDGRESIATTQVLPRVVEGTGSMARPARAADAPTVVGPRGPRSSETTQPLLMGVRPTRSAFDPPEPGGYDDRRRFDDGDFEDDFEQREFEHPDFEYAGFESATDVDDPRQAYYPGRRMNLGVVLLPMRIFLGFISIYAGMGKLCDPVYFDGGERGSMVTWLRSLDPWAIASPLHDFALAHPVGSGLTVAFVQIIVGVLTVCGLWQRVAAALGALLSVALLMTVSWGNGPAYDAPDIIYLAAWSPLVIAGAPVYSIDGRLAADAWRTLGPRADLWDLRRRVLRRGTVIATVVAGLALLTGSALGGAVRSSQVAQVPRPGEPPTNHMPGSPYPRSPGDRTDSDRSKDGQQTRGPNSGRSGGPSESASPGGRQGDTGVPSQHETVQAPQETIPGLRPPQQSKPDTPATHGGGTGTGGGGGSGSNSGGGSGGSSSGGGGGSSSGGSGGGLGGLLG